jgi:ATP-binding cassette subfamily C protein
VGKIATVTGASGAGKTTIVDLLLRLHRPESGEIRVDGALLDEMDLVRWREMMGYVPQEVIPFHDSVLANVTLGDPTRGRRRRTRRSWRRAPGSS